MDTREDLQLLEMKKRNVFYLEAQFGPRSKHCLGYKAHSVDVV
jgi:hypothetical protein